MFGLRRKNYRRPARPGEVCTCGRPARVVFASPAFGEVGTCLSSEPRKQVRPCPFCGTTGSHGGEAICPAYRVSPEWARAGYAAAEVSALVAAGAVVGVAD